MNILRLSNKGLILYARSVYGSLLLQRHCLSTTTMLSGISHTQRNSYRFPTPVFNDRTSVQEFLFSLDEKSYKKLQEELHETELEKIELLTPCRPVTKQVLRSVFQVNCIPFIGFGFLDNFIMIIAGEYIDIQLGAILGITTMTAAAVGNLISDLAGLGFAGYVESFVSKFGISAPSLTSQQTKMFRVRIANLSGRIIGITIGCIIGMAPLLFYNKKPTTENSENVNESIQTDNKKLET